MWVMWVMWMMLDDVYRATPRHMSIYIKGVNSAQVPVLTFDDVFHGDR